MILTYNDKRFLENGAYLFFRSFLLSFQEFASLPPLESGEAWWRGHRMVVVEKEPASGVNWAVLKSKVLILATDTVAPALMVQGCDPHFVLATNRNTEASLFPESMLIVSNLHAKSSKGAACSVCIHHPVFEQLTLFPFLAQRHWINSAETKEVAMAMGVSVIDIHEAMGGDVKAHVPSSHMGLKPCLPGTVFDPQAAGILSRQIRDAVDEFSAILEEVASPIYHRDAATMNENNQKDFEVFIARIEERIRKRQADLPLFIQNILSAEDDVFGRMAAGRDPGFSIYLRIAFDCMVHTNRMEGYLHWLSVIEADIHSLSEAEK